MKPFTVAPDTSSQVKKNEAYQSASNFHSQENTIPFRFLSFDSFKKFTQKSDGTALQHSSPKFELEDFNSFTTNTAGTEMLEQDAPCTSSQSGYMKKRKMRSDTQAFRMTQRKYLRIDSWECGEKSQLVSVLKEMLENDDNMFYSEDPKTIDALTQKIKEKLDSNASLLIAERRIKELLRHFIRKLKRERPGKLEAVDKWWEVIQALSPTNKHLEQQLKSAIMVAIEEPIPLFDDEKKENLKKGIPEPNYAAVYKYLACAVSGQALPELSSIDALLVEDCMQSLKQQIKTLDDGDLRLNLRKLYLCLNKAEGQSAEEEDEDDIFNQLNKASLFNPLGINQNLIVPVPPE